MGSGSLVLPHIAWLRLNTVDADVSVWMLKPWKNYMVIHSSAGRWLVKAVSRWALRLDFGLILNALHSADIWATFNSALNRRCPA
jgi:hypothetical protein